VLVDRRRELVARPYRAAAVGVVPSEVAANRPAAVDVSSSVIVSAVTPDDFALNPSLPLSSKASNAWVGRGSAFALGDRLTNRDLGGGQGHLGSVHGRRSAEPSEPRRRDFRTEDGRLAGTSDRDRAVEVCGRPDLRIAAGIEGFDVGAAGGQRVA
jgi:hypothetical protein